MRFSSEPQLNCWIHGCCEGVRFGVQPSLLAQPEPCGSRITSKWGAARFVGSIVGFIGYVTSVSPCPGNRDIRTQAKINFNKKGGNALLLRATAQLLDSWVLWRCQIWCPAISVGSAWTLWFQDYFEMRGSKICRINCWIHRLCNFSQPMSG